MTDYATIHVGEFYFGGAVGTNPTALLGTIFFEGQDLLLDSEEGIFDIPKTHKQILDSSKICQEVAVPFYLDVVADTENAMENEIKFIIKEFDVPFFIDGSDEDVKLKGLEVASKLDALDRTVYNSISVDSPDEEIERLNAIKPAAIVISAIDTTNYGVDSALEAINEVKFRLSPDLHQKLLLDIGFLDEASVKMSCEIGRELRKVTGLPVGGAPCNGLHMWKNLKARGEKDFIAALAATLGFCTAFGLDFFFAGPLRHIQHVVPAQGVSDVYNRYNLIVNNRDQSFSSTHPMQAMFKRT